MKTSLRIKEIKGMWVVRVWKIAKIRRWL